MTPFEAIAGVVNACQALPTIVTGGQPSLQHLEALKAAGTLMVIDLRDPMEPRPFDEQSAVRALGMEYRNIPVGPHTMTNETIDAVREALKTAGDEPVFLHCASANRVGGALIPHLVLDHGFDEDHALDAAMRVGLRSAELLEWGLGYARERG
jgi:protein tyrosine phosphatase (PTP) superfamily phosphohydrolase (DUF442 family)